MKYLFFMAMLFGGSGTINGQHQYSGSFRIICIEKNDDKFLIDALDLKSQDTLTVISLNATVPNDQRDKATLRVSGEYVFDLTDIDQANGLVKLPVRFPYLIQLGKSSLNRFGRDGSSSETTQYLLRNTWGLQITIENTIKE